MSPVAVVGRAVCVSQSHPFLWVWVLVVSIVQIGSVWFVCCFCDDDYSMLGGKDRDQIHGRGEARARSCLRVRFSGAPQPSGCGEGDFDRRHRVRVLAVEVYERLDDDVGTMDESRNRSGSVRTSARQW